MPKGKNHLEKWLPVFSRPESDEGMPCLNAAHFLLEYVRFKKYVKSGRIMGNSESRKQDLNFKCGQKN